MTIAIPRLLKLLKDLGRRYCGVFARLEGESDADKRKRVKLLVDSILDALPLQKKTVEEVVLDASNRLRFVLARAVLKGVIALHGQGLDDNNEAVFFEAAKQALVAELYNYFVASEALGAQHLLIVLDAWKEDVELMHKGRGAPDDTVLSEQDQAKMDSFMAACASTLGRKGQQSAMLTESQAVSTVSVLLGDLLHVTREGHALSRVLLSLAIGTLRDRFPSLSIELAECREADFACLNCPQTFRDGKMIARAPNAGVVVITLDGDLATQIPYGDGCSTRVFLQVLVIGNDLLVRRPEDLQKAVLKEMVENMAKDCPVSTLFLEKMENVAVEQRLFCFFMLAVAMGDYTLRIKESHFLRDMDGFLKTEPLFQVYRAFYAVCRKQGSNADVSWPHFIWVAKNSKISYFEAAGNPEKEKSLGKLRNRLVEALKDIDNQLEVFYGGICRLVSMFPFGDREVPLQLFLQMWPEDHYSMPMKKLHEIVKGRGWIEKARQLVFSISPVLLDHSLAKTFVSKWFKPTFKPKGATLIVMDAFSRCGLEMPELVTMHIFKFLGGRPGTWFSQRQWDAYYSSRMSVVEKNDLHWRRVNLAGVVGPHTAKMSKTEEKKHKTKKVVRTGASCDYDAQGTEHSAQKEDEIWSDFVHRLVTEPSFRTLIIDGLGVCEDVKAFCAKHKIPLSSTRSLQEGNPSGCLVGVLATAMYAGQPPLHHSGFTGRVLRGFKDFINFKTSGKISWFSNDVVLQPKAGDMLCPDCKCVLFPTGHWWHSYYDSCDCHVCISIRKGCKSCAQINQAFAVYGGVARRWEWACHKPSWSLLAGAEAKRALGPSHIEVLHPGVAMGKENSADMAQPFWNSLVSASGRLISGVNCSNDAPLAPNDQLLLYNMVKASAKDFPRVPSMERALQLQKLLTLNKMPSNKGTRGISSASGQLRDDKSKQEKKKEQQPVQEVDYSSATRRLIPLYKSICESSFAKATFGKHGNERLLMYGCQHHDASRSRKVKQWATQVFALCLKSMLPHLDHASLSACLCVSKAFRQQVMAFLRVTASRWQAGPTITWRSATRAHTTDDTIAMADVLSRRNLILCILFHVERPFLRQCAQVCLGWRHAVHHLEMQALRRAQYSKLQVDASLQQREMFSQLLVHRLHPLHAIYNNLRFLGMLANELRAVGATDGIDVPVFDRTRSKNLLMELVAEQRLDPDVLLSTYGIHSDLHGAFELLRQQGRKYVLEPARALGLAGGADVKVVADDGDDGDDPSKVAKTGPFKSLFVVAMGDDMVTRLDVPARSQVISILQTLLFIFSEGVSKNAFLTVYFAFSSSILNACAELSVVEKDDNDEADTASATPTDAAADTDLMDFLDDNDFVPLDEDDDAKKPARSSDAVLLSHARLAFQRTPNDEKVLLLRGGEKLHFLFNCIVPCFVCGDAATTFDRLDSFRKNTSFGVAKARAKSGGNIIRQGKAPFESECIGAIRNRLFRVLLDHLPDHPGFRFAPSPSQAISFHLRASDIDDFPALRSYLVGPLSEEEKLLFPDLDSSKLASVRQVTLFSLFDIGGFSTQAKVNSVSFNGGSCISAFSMEHKKASATRLLKAKPTGVNLDALYASPKERTQASAKANDKAAKRGANVTGPDIRVPVSEKRGCVTETRHIENLEKLHVKAEEKEKNGNGKRVQASAQQSGVFFKPNVEDAPQKPPPLDPGEPVQFVVKLQSNKHLWKHAEQLLEWLKDHPLVVLDAGQRWVVRGIIARFVDGTVSHDDGTVSLSFVYRGLRVSGRKWNFYVEDVGVPVECTEAELKKSVQSALDRMTEKGFLQSQDQVGDLSKIFATESFADELDESRSRLLDGQAVHRKEKRLKHQQKIALNFCRKISHLCEGFGDPIVIMGAAGGNGGRGRAQVNHDLLLKTLAGFFSIVMLDEHCTSKMTPCCHRPAHAPRSKGRSRGCKECDGRTHWWDRDAGAAWNMLSIYLSLLLTGERPAAMTKVC